MQDLLQVVEFNFGKDTSTRLNSMNQTAIDIQSCIERINEAHPYTEFYLFFESASQLHLLHYATSTNIGSLLQDIAALGDIDKIRKKTLKAFKLAMPGQLKYTDAQLTDYYVLMTKIGRLPGAAFFAGY